MPSHHGRQIWKWQLVFERQAQVVVTICLPPTLFPYFQTQGQQERNRPFWAEF